jgi:hypothetical protein
MPPITIPDYTCAHCGNRETLMLVKAPPGLANVGVDEVHRPAGAIPTLDWTCSRCGTMDTFQIVPLHVRENAR